MVAGGPQEIAAWLIDGARSCQQSDAVLAELCDRLVACGVPLWRVAVFVRTLHPDTIGRSFKWMPGVGVETQTASFDLLETEGFLKSPIAAIYGSRKKIRRRLDGDGSRDDFPFLAEIRAEGATDYFAHPLFFTDGSIHGVSWTTRRPGGFTDADVAAIETVVTPLARVAEVRALWRTAGNILDTYVGNQAGERILAGQIRRGHSESIHAAIWLSDMRGFTSLSDRLPPEMVVDVLNRYFDCQVPAILGHGGEVLKFMGDGLLAIFPIGRGDDDAAVCARVLAAAREARANVEALVASGAVEACGPLRFGLALHVGDVLYGNIGGGNRLDFTCIGPAVNLSARLEKLAAKLNRIVVASAAFARHCPDQMQHLGEFSVAGIAASQNVFGLSDEAAT